VQGNIASKQVLKEVTCSVYNEENNLKRNEQNF
jgi:hypothetical protein